MSTRHRIFAAVAAIVAIASLATGAASEEPFYKGRTISTVIGSNASGGFDTYGRLMARHMGKYIPGNPTFVVQNMPGAGGLRATNHLYNVAPKDGTMIGIVDQAIHLNQLLAVPGLQADVTRFNWIGRCVGNSAVLFARAEAKVKSAADLLTEELIVAAPGSASRLNWTALNTIVGTRMRLLTGYSGPPQAKIALQRAEIDALSLPFAVLRAENPEWLQERKVNLIIQTGIERDPLLPDLPRMVDLARSDDERGMLELFASPSKIGRSLFAPPDVPAARVKELRTAFMAALGDRDLLAEVAKLQLELHPLDGEALQRYVVDTTFPPALVARAREIAHTVGPR